jgi:hypothetical protein
MIQKLTVLPSDLTLADLIERFGPMPLSRICFDPGQAPRPSRHSTAERFYLASN